MDLGVVLRMMMMIKTTMMIEFYTLDFFLCRGSSDGKPRPKQGTSKIKAYK